MNGRALVDLRRLKQLKAEGESITMNENIEVLAGAFSPTPKAGRKPLKDHTRRSHITLFLIHAFGVNQMSPLHAYNTVKKLNSKLIDSSIIKSSSALARVRELQWLFDIETDDLDIVIDNINTFVSLFDGGVTELAQRECELNKAHSLYEVATKCPSCSFVRTN